MTPRFWLETGYHGAETELHSDLFGYAEEAVLYREGACPTYVFSVLRPRARLIGQDGGIWTSVFAPFESIASDATCVNARGEVVPRAVVSCFGAAPLGLPP